jgi:hypothetical protein
MARALRTKSPGRELMRLTKITVLHEKWEVPRGFGAAYDREARFQLDLIRKVKPARIIDRVCDSLLLIGYSAARDVVVNWDLRRRVEAVVYAQNVQLRASDNPIPRHPKPVWLPEPWMGPYAGEGVWAGPMPTVVT